MAAIPAQIALNWISNYNGPHRVCYRIGSTGSYTCTVFAPGTPTHPNCPGGGLPCSYNIDITVDQETCDTVTYEGYVQPTCEERDSLANRTPFSVSFVPNPACKRYEVLCASNGVLAINIVGGGSGYTPGSNPAVTITGDGVSATATATVDGSGVVTSIVVDTPGSGYTFPPTITIAPPSSGTTATATATLADCTGIVAQDCDGVGPETHYPVAVGDFVAVCAESLPGGFPDEYTVSENGTCLCDCVNVDINNTGPLGDLNVTYVDCLLQTKVSATIPAGNGLSGICIVNGSLTYEEVGNAVFNLVNNGVCDGDGI